MDDLQHFKDITSLLGEPARATMLWSLLDGKALTATELAICAEISSQSASMHLAKLVQADILRVESQGRHRYYRLARPEVAYVVEALASLVPEGKKGKETAVPPANGIRYCRTCYDHLAGKVAVEITGQLLKREILIASADQFTVSQQGWQWLNALGIENAQMKNQRRKLARQCLDWSERKHHVAGALGAALLNKWLELGWVKRQKNSRAAIITADGQKGLYRLLQLNV